MEQYSRRFIEELANHIDPVIIDYFNKKRNLLNFSAENVADLWNILMERPAVKI